MTVTVDLYEDGGGQLYLTSGDVGWAGLEYVDGAALRQDAIALAAGDTDDWTVPQYPASELIGDSARLVARATVREGACEVRGVQGATIGYAARRYLGPDLEAVAAEAGYDLD